jgi:hypothetical protein
MIMETYSELDLDEMQDCVGWNGYIPNLIDPAEIEELAGEDDGSEGDHPDEDCGEPLSDRVLKSIRRLGTVHVRRMGCACSHSTVTLSGQVTSAYARSVVHTIASRVPGVRHVVNQIVVIDCEKQSREF